jgi:hypothetical protein
MTQNIPECARKLLNTLADHFEAHPSKWKRGFPADGDCFCIANGVEHFAPDHAVCNEAYDRLGRVLATVYIGTWNDKKAKDVDEVIAVLRKAATL